MWRGRGRGRDEGEVVWWVGRYTGYKVPKQFHQKGENIHKQLSPTIPLNTGSEYTTSVPLYSRYTEKNIPSIAPIHTIRIPIKLPARNKEYPRQPRQMDDQVLHCYTWWYMCPTGRQETFVGLAYQPAPAGRQAM